MLLQSFLLFLTISDVAVECKLVNLIERLKGNWINTTKGEVCSIQEKKLKRKNANEDSFFVYSQSLIATFDALCSYLAG